VASMHGVMLSKIPESNAYELTSSLEMALLELWWLVGVVVREEAARGSVL
jgi:hypothetical protein